MDCLFCKIVAGEIPSKKVFENDEFIVINDINPQAKVHLIAIPKEHFADIGELDDNRAILVGKIIKKLGEIAKEMGLDDGYRIVSNKGKFGCQTIMHLHIHLLGGEQLGEKMN